MKKLFLLLAVGALSAPAIAQYSQTLMRATQAEERGTPTAIAPIAKTTGFANKTTGGPKEGWFDYVSIYYQSGTSVGYYWRIYQDSTPTYLNTTNNTRSSIFSYGIGMSFDPSAKRFKDDFYSATPTFAINAANPYSIDSVAFGLRYMKQPYNNYNDSVIVELVATGDTSHTFRLQYSPSADGYLVNADDSIMRFADATYDNVNNKMSDSIASGNRVRIARLLTTNDTALGSGFNEKLPTPLMVGANQKVVAYIHYKSGHTYPLGMDIDSVNHLRLYTYEVDGADTYPVQNGAGANYGPDYNCFLWSSKQAKYGTGSTNNNYFYYKGHKLLIPSVAYADPTGFGLSDIAFYVKCANCELLSVKNTTDNISEIKAYPNPTNAEVNISYTLKTAAAASVKVMNSVGQVVNMATVAKGTSGKVVFSTQNLANGIYFYTVEADGQKLTNRFVVAH